MSSNTPPSPGATDRRRASITGQTFQDLFGRQNSFPAPQNPTTPYPGPITTAAVNAQRRRLSLTTIGLSTSPNQPFQPRQRTESLSSANSGSVDESPFEDDPAPSASGSSSNPATPFARRLSFGARALRDVRQSNGNGTANGRPSIHKASSPPTARGRGLSSSSPSFPSPLSVLVPPLYSSAFSQRSASTPLSAFPPTLPEHFAFHLNQPLEKHELTSSLSPTGEGYNFAENLRSRAERSSMSGAHPTHNPAPQPHQRAKSVAIMEPPAREMPKPKVPDAMQERILKGDFYMD